MPTRADQLIQPLVISAPFGNYIQPRATTPTLGTFTVLRRPGRLWRFLRTVRYYPRAGAWINQIGLRNPGIDWLEARCNSGRVSVADKILSIHGVDEAEWRLLLTKAAALRPLAVELNMSSPNIGHVNWPEWLFAEAAAIEHAGHEPPAVIVKLPPVNYRQMFDRAIAAGLRWFHCCNTIPTPRGGISGKPLKPVALACIADLVELTPPARRPDLRIIGGGGITTPPDIDDYAAAGATRFAVGSMLFNPRFLTGHGALAPLVRRAESHARRNR